MISRARTTARRPFNARFEGRKLAAYHELRCGCEQPRGLGLTTTGTTFPAGAGFNVGGAAGGASGVYSAYKSGDLKSGVVAGASAGSAFGPWGAAIGGIIGGIAGSLKGRQSAASKGDQKAGREMRDIYRAQVQDKIMGRDIPLDVFRDLIIGSQAMGAICCGFPENYGKKWDRIKASIKKVADQAKSQPLGAAIAFDVPNVGTKEDKGNYKKFSAPNPGPDAVALLNLWMPAARLQTHKASGTIGSTDATNVALFRDLFDHFLGQSAPIPPWAPANYRQPPPPPTPAAPVAPAAPAPTLTERAAFARTLTDAQLRAALEQNPRGSEVYNVLLAELARRQPSAPAPVPAAPASVPAPVTVSVPSASSTVLQTPPPPAPSVPNLTPAVVDSTNELIRGLLAQGVGQQQVITQALAALSAQGITPTPQVTQAVQSEVAAAAPASSSVPLWLGAGALVGLLLLSRRR